MTNKRLRQQIEKAHERIRRDHAAIFEMIPHISSSQIIRILDRTNDAMGSFGNDALEMVVEQGEKEAAVYIKGMAPTVRSQIELKFRLLAEIQKRKGIMQS